MISQKFNTGLLHYNSLSENNIRIAKRVFQEELSLSKTFIPYNERFSKENLQKMSEHKWMTDVDMTLVTIDKYPTWQDLYDELTENAYDINNETIPMLKDRELKVISIDLETTGLSKVFKRVGGAIVADTKVVGLCIGVSPYKAYYIPLLHNEQDDIKNLPMRYGKELLNALEANCFTIYHQRNCYTERWLRLMSLWIAISLALIDYVLVWLMLMAVPMLQTHMDCFAYLQDLI